MSFTSYALPHAHMHNFSLSSSSMVISALAGFSIAAGSADVRDTLNILEPATISLSRMGMFTVWVDVVALKVTLVETAVYCPPAEEMKE